MIINYSSACGVLGALRRNSIKEDELDRIEKKEQSFLKNLLKKYLGQDYPSEEEIDSFERALYLSFIKKIVKLLKFLPPEPSFVLKTLLSEFDILNLKILIRQITLNTDRGKELFYWGFPYLAFKDINPSTFKDVDTLEQYLIKRPYIKEIFKKGLDDLNFHKDIFYFDISLDREYFKLLENISTELDEKSKNLIRHFITIKILIYALRLRFFQGKDVKEILSIMGKISPLNKDVSFLKTSSLQESISVIEKSYIFEKLSLDFEEDIENTFYNQFLKKRGVNFFTLYPYLVFYLNQRYLIEKVIFIINDKLK